MAADKGKKLKVADQRSEDQENSDEIDAKLMFSIEKLQEVQDDLEKLNEEASEKVLEVEQKYNEIRRPVFNKRTEIIKSIPDFWLNAFLCHPDISNLLNEEDQKIFKYMDSLDVEDFKDMKSGYSITFGFRENPYFENTKLTKTITFVAGGTTKITGTTINWKDGTSVEGAAPHGNNPKKKGTKRPYLDESFFTWFGETVPQDVAELQDELLVFQMQVAETIKEELWPNPLNFFNNGDELECIEDEEENDGEDKQDGDHKDGN